MIINRFFSYINAQHTLRGPGTQESSYHWGLCVNVSGHLAPTASSFPNIENEKCHRPSPQCPPGAVLPLLKKVGHSFLGENGSRDWSLQESYECYMSLL